MIYRGLSAAADRFAHRGKPKTPDMDKYSVVVLENHKVYHILWSPEIIPTSQVSLASILCTQGLFTPIVGDA